MPRSFSELGRLVDQLARSRDVQGPKAISEHVREKTGGGPGRSAWGKVLFGDITPTPNTMRLFGKPSSSTRRKRRRLLGYTPTVRNRRRMRSTESPAGQPWSARPQERSWWRRMFGG
jgi:hypothetical protein